MIHEPVGHRLAWERALDELEAFTYLAESQLRALRPVTDGPWSLPDLGPIPVDLVERARALLARQQHVLEQLTTAMERVRQQRNVTERFIQATSRCRGSVYVDANA